MSSSAPRRSPRAVVVGAGVGGLAVSIHLALRGYEVEVFEKQGSPGGRCGRLARDGHRFDLGATLLLMPDLVSSVFADWGEDADGHLRPTRVDPLYAFHFADGTRLEMTSDLRALAEQIEALEPGGFERWLEFFALGRRQYQAAMRILGRNYRRARDYFNLANARDFLACEGHRNYASVLRRHLKHPHLQAMFSFQTMYVGQSPFASSALFCMLPALGLLDGGWHPAGGMHQVAASLAAIAARHGVRLHVDAPVAAIECGGGRARALRLESGDRVQADVVISNADVTYTCGRLLGDRAAAARLERMRYTCSAIVFHWALDRAFPQLGHHSVFLAGDYRGALDAVFRRGEVAGEPHFYVNRPTSTEPGAAPPGRDGMTVIVPAGHVDRGRPQDWPGLVARARAAVLRRLAGAGLDDLERHLAFEVVYDPPTWERELHLTRGALFGSLDHRPSQMGYLRPSNRHPSLPNVFFVGGSTHPGSAVPLALLSARLTAERVLQAAGRSRAVPGGDSAWTS